MGKEGAATASPGRMPSMRGLLLGLIDPAEGLLALMNAGLAGLTDDEYLWEPVADCWSVRPVSDLRTPLAPWHAPDGWAAEIVYPDPQPSPFTSIAWRLTHMTGSVNVASATVRGVRRDDGAIDDAFASSGEAVGRTAAEAIALWDGAIARLRGRIEDAEERGLFRLERQWWDPPDHSAAVWQQVIYFAYFEPASHGAEVRLLRDLYRHTKAGRVALLPPRNRTPT